MRERVKGKEGSKVRERKRMDTSQREGGGEEREQEEGVREGVRARGGE